jgi:hypothetical protein
MRSWRVNRHTIPELAWMDEEITKPFIQGRSSPNQDFSSVPPTYETDGGCLAASLLEASNASTSTVYVKISDESSFYFQN